MLRRFWVPFTLFLLLIFALLLGLNMRRGLNHDEHQFLASGKLVAQGLLPYRDFPYFHAPTLSLIYGLLFRSFDPLLLTARIFSVVCSWLGLAVIGWLAWRLSADLRAPWRWMLVISPLLLLIATPLFIYTSGRAWNHDLPVLLMVLAVVSYRHSLWVSGFLIGLAASTRLSFAFLAPAFLLTTWWEICSTQRLAQTGHQGAKTLTKTVRLCCLAALRFTTTFLLGFAPAWWFWLQAPDQFFFGNVAYVRLNTLYYRGLAQAPMSMTLLGKFAYLWQLLTREPGNLLLGLSFVAALLGISRSHAPRGNAGATLRVNSPHPISPRTREGTVNPKAWFSLRLILWGLILMLISALVATPSQAQYFYVLWPLLALGTLVALTRWPRARQRWGILGLGLLAGVAFLFAIPQYVPGVGDLPTPTDWYPHKVHRRAQTLTTLVGAGKVLTLAPLYPLEGNLPTYPALATGSFAWRVAPLVDPPRRIDLGLFDPTQLAATWRADPPRGVLVGSEQDDAVAEAALVAQAQAQGYIPIATLDKQTLWLSPLAEWGGAIRLGAHTLPRSPLAPGEAFQAVFYLQKVGPIAQNLNRLVRFVGEEGSELLRNEGWPWGSATSTWPQDEVWPDGVELVIPAGAKAGVYRVEVSFYDPADFAPLGEAMTVGEVEVQ